MRERGFTYTELLIAVVLVAMAGTYAVSTWSLSSRAPANKRVTEMGVYIATQELERLKALKYLGLPDTGANPVVTYYDRYGAVVTGPVAQGYKAKTWIRPVVNRDGVPNIEDVLELRVEVWDSRETRRHETARTLLAFGGV